jgi:hypothetical protein
LGRLLDAKVTVTAINAKAGHMVLVRELNGLYDEVVLLGDPRRPIPKAGGASAEGDKRHHSHDEHPHLNVGVAVEDLSQLQAPSGMSERLGRLALVAITIASMDFEKFFTSDGFTPRTKKTTFLALSPLILLQTWTNLFLIDN